MRPAYALCFCALGGMAAVTLGCGQQKKEPTPPPPQTPAKAAAELQKKDVKPAEPAKDVKSPDHEAAAKTFVDLLVKDEFDKATNDFDAKMTEVLPPAKLQETWKALTAQVGAFKQQGKTRIERKDQHVAVFVTCVFEKASLDAKVVFDANKKIAGLFFVPTAPSTEGKPGGVSLKTKTGTLYGTLDLPTGAGPHPVVLILAGSGPTDRDGNQLQLQNDSLKMLGAGLAARGIAALRCDKRGIGQSASALTKEQDLRFETYVEDAVGWVELLRGDRRFARVGIVGHSEGSLIGMLAAKRAKADAFVSVAGAARSAPALLREQLEKQLSALPALKAASDQIIGELVAGRTVADVPKELAPLYRPSVQPYLMSWFKYDPAREIATLDVPVLIVQGTTDIQIPVEDARRLAAAKKGAQLCIIDGMNHVLKRATSKAEQDAAYTDRSVPLDPRVPELVAGFLAKALAKSQ